MYYYKHYQSKKFVPSYKVNLDCSIWLEILKKKNQGRQILSKDEEIHMKGVTFL